MGTQDRKAAGRLEEGRGWREECEGGTVFHGLELDEMMPGYAFIFHHAFMIIIFFGSI